MTFFWEQPVWDRRLKMELGGTTQHTHTHTHTHEKAGQNDYIYCNANQTFAACAILRESAI